MEKEPSEPENPLGTIVIGNLEGDRAHDTPRGMVRKALKRNGFKVVDLGKNIPASVFVSKAKENNATIIAVSINTQPAKRNIPKLDEALKCAIILVIDYPENSRAYNLRGKIYYLKGEYEIALKDLSLAISLEPEDSSLHFNRGTIYFRLNNFSEALIDFSKSIQLNRKYADAYKWRARIYKIRRQYLDALSDINMYTKLSPKDAGGYYVRASIYFSQKKIHLFYAVFSNINTRDKQTPNS